MLNYKNIKSDRQWKGTIALSCDQFHRLCKVFSACFEELNQISLIEMATNLNSNFLLKTYEDCLFYVLFQLKNGLSYDSLGLLINTDSSNAQRNFEKYLAVLELALVQLGAMPKRGFKDIAEFEEYFKDEAELTLDATEHSTQRPADNDAQKEAYSGKKSNTRTKNCLLVTKKGEFYTLVKLILARNTTTVY